MIEHPEDLRISFDNGFFEVKFHLEERDYYNVKQLLQRAQAGEIKMEEIFGLIRDMSSFLLRRYTQSQKERLHNNGKSND